jgi:4-hydroxybenzoate polyprenyltransferase
VALAVLVAIVAALTGLLVIAAVAIGLAILNLVYLPRVAARLRVPATWLAVSLLPLIVAGGLLVSGVSGAAWGAAIWVAAIGLPRVVGRDLTRRMTRRFNAARGRKTYEAEFRTPTGRPAEHPLPPADDPGRGGSAL